MSSPLTPIAACRQPQNRHACQLEIRSPGLQVATVTDLVSLAREKRPELVVVDIRIPPTRTTEGLDTARVITRSCPTSASWCSPRTSKSAMRWQIGSRGLATSQSVYCPPPHGRPQTEARLPASVHRGRSGRWPPPRPVDPAGRVLPGPRCSTHRSRVGSSSSRSSATTSTSPPDQVGLVFDPRPIRRGPRATPGRFPDQGDHRRGHPEPARGRQTHHDQAVRECPAHRDHHHRHQRFRDRETTDESARAAGDRRHRQPAPARRPTNRPRPDHRGPIPAHRHRTRHHRDRHPHPRPAPGVSGAAMPCSPRCRCFGSNPTASPTKISAIDRRTAGSTTRRGHL